MAKDQKEKLETIEAELADQENRPNDPNETASQEKEECTKDHPTDEKDQDFSEAKDSNSDKELAELQDQLFRLQAELINYRKRVERDRADVIQFANEKLIIELIAVLDNFHRALASEKEHDHFYQGMELIFQQFLKALEDHGVEEFAADGEDFDPNLHHAVLMEESEEVESGKIIETLQRGYKLNGKLVRPAMVKVAK